MTTKTSQLIHFIKQIQQDARLSTLDEAAVECQKVHDTENQFRIAGERIGCEECKQAILALKTKGLE